MSKEAIKLLEKAKEESIQQGVIERIDRAITILKKPKEPAEEAPYCMKCGRIPEDEKELNGEMVCNRCEPTEKLASEFTKGFVNFSTMTR